MTQSNLPLQEIKLELTNHCPLSCIHCSTDAHPGKNTTIPPAKATEIITEAASLGAKEIAFSGGEPLTYKELGTLIKVSKANGIRPTVYTTGNVPDVDKVFKGLQSSGLSRAAFSLFHHDQEQHELVTRSRGSFATTVKAIRSAQKYKIACEIHFVALSKNITALPSLIDFAKTIGVSKISILRFVPQGRGSLLGSSGVPSVAQYLELRELILRLRSPEMDIRTGSPMNFLHINNPPQCLTAQNRVIVSPELRLFPCDAFKQISPEEIGISPKYSSLETDSLSACWSKSAFLREVRAHLASGFGPACSQCSFLHSCGSGCLAQKAIFSQALVKDPDPSCIGPTLRNKARKP